MDPHFRAFSFVDRITSLSGGSRVAGYYEVPDGLTAFPTSLVSEAIGQLAAWSAMASLGFEHRPVAGIASRVEMPGAVQPGQRLELEADLESVSAEAVTYSGEARVNGHAVVRLVDCVGPMLSLEEFDDPASLRERFDLLTAVGAAPGAFQGVPELDLEAVRSTGNDAMTATLEVPAEADFFADHFPRRPVFPGTLLTHNALKLAVALAESTIPASDGMCWRPRVVTDVKLRAFTPPGTRIELEARRRDGSDEAPMFALQLRVDGKRTGSLRTTLSREPSS
jgi:3-hydroxymyristoyl/3-hydroxydecanoyl-(acyl carrier protein) dehydratase